MPVRKVKGGWQWGKHGKVYRGKSGRALAARQGRAIHAAESRRKKGKR